jgi:hypothetical protein
MVAPAGIAAERSPVRYALVAQLDRASDFESEGREFESLRARQLILFNKKAMAERALWAPKRAGKQQVEGAL